MYRRFNLRTAFSLVAILLIAWSPQVLALGGTVSCAGGTGTATFEPILLEGSPAVRTAIETSFPSCTGTGNGAGISAAVSSATITAVALCVVGSNIVNVNAGNVGNVTVYWDGGTGSPSTTFLTTTPATAQLTSNQPVVVGTGLSTAGRFNTGLPAVLTLSTSVAPIQGVCPDIDSIDLIDVELTVTDVL